MTVEQTDRAAIANEVFGDQPAEQSPEVIQPEVVKDAGQPVIDSTATPEAKEVDPWAGVPTALREQFEGMQAKLQSLEKFDYRLKQAESRVGSVQNELHAAREAAKAVTNAPSKEQIADASASQADWDQLKEDFPEWTKAIGGRIAAERAEILKSMPDINKARSEIQADYDKKLVVTQARLGGDIVAMKHPEWRKTQTSPDFQQWFVENKKEDSLVPAEIIKLFDDYEAHIANRKSVAEIEAERQKRLEASQSTPGRRLPAAKSQADMTPSELRAEIARQTWNNP